MELKPCPFCGNEAKLSGKYGIGKVDCWAVYCGKTAADFACGAQVTSIISEEAAIAAWNRRYGDGMDKR